MLSTSCNLPSELRWLSFARCSIIASCGVVLGAIMSSGMMDIARHGIMSPDHFTFEEVMTLFLAVMVTDVIILDVFNTLGMPTSTTVSLVFELLGGAFILATSEDVRDDSLNYGVLLNSNKGIGGNAWVSSHPSSSPSYSVPS